MEASPLRKVAKGKKEARRGSKANADSEGLKEDEEEEGNEWELGKESLVLEPRGRERDQTVCLRNCRIIVKATSLSLLSPLQRCWGLFINKLVYFRFINQLFLVIA